MEKGLVSIISPCYNREKILWRFLDSVLDQTYKKIQLILIDDGSTDGTLSVIKEYISKFEKAGIRYEYYTKPNGGVSSSINEGLKYVKGEFLCWPDSDDWYEPESIEKRVEFLNDHPEFGIVSSDASAILSDGKTVLKESAAGNTLAKFESKQFELLLEGKSLICCICHMVRTEAFFLTHPGKRIFDSRYGQNIQMLLPVYYSYDRGYIDEILAHYLVLDSSLSHLNTGYKEELAYRNSIELLTTETLKSIPLSDNENKKYTEYCHVNNTRRRLILATKYEDIEYAKIQIKELFLYKKIKAKDLLMYIKLHIKNMWGGVKPQTDIYNSYNIITENGGVLCA